MTTTSTTPEGPPIDATLSSWFITAEKSPVSVRRDAVRNREAIVTAAIETLDRDPDASVDTIAANAGISRRAIYRHFGSKDTLIRGVTQLLMTRAIDALTGLRSVPGGVDLQIAVGAVRLWDALGKRRRLINYRLNGSVRAFAFKQAAPLRVYLLDLLRQGQQDSTVRSDISAEAVQYLIETHAAALLEVAVESPLEPSETRLVFVLSILGDIGLSAHDAQVLLGDHPDLFAEGQRTAGDSNLK
jgi:AcrR family transcriptional regulator